MKNTAWIRLALAALALAIVSGCASLPSPEQMRAEVAGYALPKTPDPNKAVVYIVRPSQIGAIVRFNVFLNDQEDRSEMGFTRGGQFIHFNVAPGTHKIYSKAENWAETNVTVKAGDIVFIQQEPTMGIIMARNNLFMLDEVQGKWTVKNTTIGTIHKTDK